MDRDRFVQNIKFYCDRNGVKPTIACEESGAGKNLINHLLRQGSEPSVGRVQLLAQYLGVTVSDLLGESMTGSIAAGSDSPFFHELVNCFSRLNENGQRRLLEHADDMVKSGKYLEKKSASAG